MKIIKDFIIDDIEELVSNVVDSINKGEAEFVAIIAKYEEASAIVKEVLQYDETSIDYISLFSEDFNGYDKEYLIIIDENWTVSCKQLYDEDCEDYKYFKSDRIYIFEDCSSSSVFDFEDENVNVVIFSDSIRNNIPFDNSNVSVSIWNNENYSGLTTSTFENDGTYKVFTYMSKNNDDIDDLLKILGYRE